MKTKTTYVEEHKTPASTRIAVSVKKEQPQACKNANLGR